MRRGRRIALIALLVALVVPAGAGRVIDVRPHRSDDWLRVDVRAADLLDPRTRSTVESGLPGSARLQLELRDGRGEVAVRRLLERAIEFDLWEGVARVRDRERVIVFPSIAAADSAWAHFDGIGLLPWNEVDPETTYRLFVRIDVESFGREERERVSRYVSESERGDRRELAFDLGGLVKRWVGAGSETTDDTVWRGPVFRPGDLPRREDDPEPQP